MNKILKKTRVGWVYLLGIALMVGFSVLSLKEGDLGVLSAGNQTVSQNSAQGAGSVNEDKKNASEKAPTTATKPASTQTQNKDIQKSVVSQGSQAQNTTIQATNSQQGQTVAVEPVVPVKKDTVEMDITGLGKYKVEIKEGDTAFDALKRAASQNVFPIGYKIYSFGMMVSKIGSNESQGTYYWALYYNGGYSMVGSSDLLIKDKDIIEWRYESWM